ncbi:hypothetical protein [Paractinoplanes atraurantiacus]|uniref:hypothetical protein n=1 Tax=Paractinoplanes atraurantiacus TaxID=1036182 RepID=UPI0011781074|nr:hypothetical protein [Actinoplanes atraurantiacus]
MDETSRMTPAARAALVALSQGSCDFPGCRTPVMVFLGTEPEVNVEPVRIRGADPDGPRYTPGSDPSSYDSFDNLLLLCVPHRKTIDHDEKSHPVELLQSWKPSGPLSSLQGLTEQRLDALLTTAFSTAHDQIDEALTAFEKSDPAAAQLLRELTDTLHDQRARYGADPRLTTALTTINDRLDTLLAGTPPPRPPRVNIGWRS